MQIPFVKYQGAGNDFVIIDNRNGNIQLTKEQIHFLCDRRFGIGADGLMLLNSAVDFDFEMVYYNADGAEGSMCGNGGRCITQFAFDLGIHKENYLFIASDGPHEAFFGNNKWIHLKMKDVNNIITIDDGFVLDTGSPHYVKEVDNVEKTDVVHKGREIRYNDDFKQDGINVNFVQVEHNKIIVRTYERGVEDETLSCGTGVTASSLVFAHNENGFNRVEVSTKGGHLAVEFDKIGEHQFNNIWLCGPATLVYKGSIEIN
jgi:diaminopimelate epimerase